MWILQRSAAALAAFVAFLVLLRSKWGEAYLGQRFERVLADRGKRSNEMESNAIKLVWEKFVEAYLATHACIAQTIQVPDLFSMSAAEFAAFLSVGDFSESQKQQLITAQDRQKTYSDILTWTLIVKAQHAIFNARLSLRKQGIFMPSALKDDFAEALDILSEAQAEQQMDHQNRQSGIGQDKRSSFLEEAEAIFAELGAAANQRLFRDELAEKK